jgi:NAD(P)-dependent dehydrogenase (short-subunit alcohol dehydrogenase family)
LKFVFSPDIIVSALGVNPRLHSDSIDEASWPETIHFNLNLPLLVVKAYAPQMKSRR